MIELDLLFWYLLLFLAAGADWSSSTPALETGDADLKNLFGMVIPWLYFNSHLRRGQAMSFRCAFFILYCSHFLGGSRLLSRTPSARVADSNQGVFVESLIFPFILIVYQTLSTKLTTKASSSTLALSRCERGSRVFNEAINF